MEETNPKVNEASAADATENSMEQNNTTPPIVDNSLESTQKEEEVRAEDAITSANQIELSNEMIADEAQLQEEKEEEMPIESFAHLSKIELLDKLKNLAQTDEDGSAWQDVRTIKAAFYELVKEDQEKKLQAFIADGGLRE